MNNLLLTCPGPSSRRVDLSLFSNYEILMINRFFPGVTPTYYHFNDTKIMQSQMSHLKEWKGTVITNTAHGLPGRKNLKYNALVGQGWSEDPNKGYYLENSSAYSACQWASWQGYEKIVVIGLDQTAENQKFYFNSDRPAPNREGHWASEGQTFQRASDKLQKFLFVSDLNQRPWFQEVPHCSPDTLRIFLNV